MEINKRRNNKNNLMSNKTAYTQNAQRIREQILKLHCEIQIFTISQLSKYLSVTVMNQIRLQFHSLKHL